MALVTFLGTPAMTFYRGSEPGCAVLWLPGEVRELPEEVAASLMETFPDAFSVAKAKVPAKKTAAVKAPKTKAPATKTRAATPKAKKGKA
jgi:hypothetical protein